VFQQNVVARVELDELGARNAAREQPSFRDWKDGVFPRVQDERGRAHLGERRRDVRRGIAEAIGLSRGCPR
jgi:hypothetical protein